MPATVFPTGVTINRPDKSYPTYVMFDGRDGCSRLIDMNGIVVHSWPHTGFPAEVLDPAVTGRRGNVMLQREHSTFENKAILEMDWDANVVWSWGDSQSPWGAAKQNHDHARLANGNTLFICHCEFNVPELTEKPFIDQPIIEVDRKGEIVWSWYPHQHLDELGLSAEQKRLLFAPEMRVRIAGILNLNNLSPLGPNRWFDAGDERFHPDNLMIDSREANFVAIIEKTTGKVVWRLGPDLPGSYDFSKKRFSGPVPRPIDSISGLHDAHIISKGLAGAGNLLIFDNQGIGGFPPVYLNLFSGSRVIEVDPLSQEIVWQYDGSKNGDPSWMFYSSFISSARRLPNGNTLICEGMHGRLFQVTPEGENVWEFVNPFYGPYSVHLDTRHGALHNWVFRAQPVPRDWVPEGTPFQNKAVIPPKNAEFRMPA